MATVSKSAKTAAGKIDANASSDPVPSGLVLGSNFQYVKNMCELYFYKKFFENSEKVGDHAVSLVEEETKFEIEGKRNSPDPVTLKEEKQF